MKGIPTKFAKEFDSQCCIDEEQQHKQQTQITNLENQNITRIKPQ